MQRCSSILKRNDVGVYPAEVQIDKMASSSGSLSIPSVSSNIYESQIPNANLDTNTNLSPNTNQYPNTNPPLNVIPETENVPTHEGQINTVPTRGGWKRKKAQPRAGKRAKTSRKGGVRSEVWNCFTRPKLSDGSLNPDVAQCNYCNELVPADTYSNGTSSLWTHGKKCRASPLYEKPVDGKSQTTLNKDNVSGAVGYHKFNKQRCNAACVKMIIMDELPFMHVEGQGFKDFVFELQPQWVRMNRKQVAAGVWELYQIEKAKLMSQFATHQTRVSITTDTWTSIQNINYMVVTAHFLDSDWNLHKRILNFCSIISHKGDDIGRVLEQCLYSWGIHNVFTITVDNASANDTVVAYMRRRLKTLFFNGDFIHQRCACHVINLVVKDGIGEIADGIDAIWHCVKFIRSSSSRLDKFRDFSVLEQLSKNANVPLDVITRWNNTYLMLDAALKYEKVFERMGDEDEAFRKYFKEKDSKGIKRVGPPSKEDWRNAQAFMHFLGKFYEATLKLSAWKKVTANILFSELIGLQTEINMKMNDDTYPILKRVAAGMKQKFDKYWGSFEQMNKIIVIANVLDPRWKLQYQKMAFAKVGVSSLGVGLITSDLKAILMRMYDEYKVPEAASSRTNTSEGVLPMEGVEFHGVDGGQAEILAELMRERLDEQSEMISNEVDKYLSDRYVHPMTPNFDVAQWWKVNAGAYPILSKLAKDIFAIPSSTVASANAFSLGKRVVDPYRSSLTPKMVECLVCSSDWLNATQPNFYKEPTVIELEMYQELEELERGAAGIRLEDPTSSATTTTTTTTTAT